MVSVLVMVSEDADGIALKGHELELDCKLRPIYKVQLKCPASGAHKMTAFLLLYALLRHPRKNSDENQQCVPVDRG